MTADDGHIWYRPHTLAEINALHARTLVEHLGIDFTEIGRDHLRARMPVDGRTLQPFGLLHGGASVVLAETLGSVGGTMTIDPSRLQVVGQEVNANHIRGVRDGWVTGTARPVHLGGRSQVWGIEIVDREGRLACVARLTLAIFERHAGRVAT